MKKGLIFLVFLGIVLIAVSPAQALFLSNESFEDGMNYWSEYTEGNGNAYADDSHYILGYGWLTATDGDYFANLKATAIISQPTSWVVGDTLTFDYAWDLDDYLNDQGALGIFDANDNLIDSVILGDNSGSMDWQSYTYAFSSAGNGYIKFGSLNYEDEWFDSRLLIDNISTASVPEPGTIVLMGLGLVGLAGMGRKKLFKK